jgi:hypothetical protein
LGTLTHAGEYRQALVRLGDVVDQLHHVDRLAHAGAAEQADLAALGERADQIDHLDAGFQQIVAGSLLVVARRLAMDHPLILLADRAGFVDGVAQHVHDAAERGLADRHLDAFAGVARNEVTAQAVGRTQRDAAHDAVAQLLLHFQRDRRAVDFQCVIHLRHFMTRELHVDDGADDLNYFALAHEMLRM